MLEVILVVAGIAGAGYLYKSHRAEKKELRARKKALYKQRPRPVKIYDYESGHSNDKIALDGNVVLWIRYHSTSMANQKITIRVDHKQGPKVAAAKLNPMSSQCRVLAIKDPEQTPESEWIEVVDEGFGRDMFGFRFEHKKYLWKETTEYMDKGFKLVDAAAPHDTLMICVVKYRRIIRFDIFKELGLELELTSLIALIAVRYNAQVVASREAKLDQAASSRTVYMPTTTKYVTVDSSGNRVY